MNQIMKFLNMGGGEGTETEKNSSEGMSDVPLRPCTPGGTESLQGPYLNAVTNSRDAHSSHIPRYYHAPPATIDRNVRDKSVEIERRSRSNTPHSRTLSPVRSKSPGQLRYPGAFSAVGTEQSIPIEDNNSSAMNRQERPVIRRPMDKQYSIVKDCSNQFAKPTEPLVFCSTHNTAEPKTPDSKANISIMGQNTQVIGDQHQNQSSKLPTPIQTSNTNNTNNSNNTTFVLTAISKNTARKTISTGVASAMGSNSPINDDRQANATNHHSFNSPKSTTSDYYSRETTLPESSVQNLLVAPTSAVLSSAPINSQHTLSKTATKNHTNQTTAVGGNLKPNTNIAQQQHGTAAVVNFTNKQPKWRVKQVQQETESEPSITQSETGVNTHSSANHKTVSQLPTSSLAEHNQSVNDRKQREESSVTHMTTANAPETLNKASNSTANEKPNVSQQQSNTNFQSGTKMRIPLSSPTNHGTRNGKTQDSDCETQFERITIISLSDSGPPKITQQSSFSKSETAAEKAMKDGESAFNNRDYDTSLACYCAAICLAPDFSRSLAIAFGQRAFIALYHGEVRSAISDINRALEIVSDKSERLVQKWMKILNDAEKQDKLKRLDTVEYPEDALFDSQFARIQGLSDSVRLRWFDDSNQRKLVANKCIPKGSVILREKAYAWAVDQEFQLELCQNCAGLLPFDWLPCFECSRQKVRYCSMACRNDAWERFHRWECTQPSEQPTPHPVFVDNPGSETNQRFCLLSVDTPGYDMMATRILLRLHPDDVVASVGQLHKISPKFGSAPRDNFGGNFKSMMSLASYPNSKDIDWSVDMSLPVQLRHLYPDESKRELAVKMLMELRLRIIQNSCPLEVMTENDEDHSTKPKGTGIYPIGSLLTHSCVPNTRRHFNGNSMEIRACVDLEPGDELSVSYGAVFGRMRREERQQYMQTMYGINCECTACTDEDFVKLESEMFAPPNTKQHEYSIERLNGHLVEAEWHMRTHAKSALKMTDDILTVSRYYFGPDSYQLLDFLVPILKLYESSRETARRDQLIGELCRLLSMFYGVRAARQWFGWHMKQFGVKLFDSYVQKSTAMITQQQQIAKNRLLQSSHSSSAIRPVDHNVNGSSTIEPKSKTDSIRLRKTSDSEVRQPSPDAVSEPIESKTKRIVQGPPKQISTTIRKSASRMPAFATCTFSSSSVQSANAHFVQQKHHRESIEEIIKVIENEEQPDENGPGEKISKVKILKVTTNMNNVPKSTPMLDPSPFTSFVPTYDSLEKSTVPLAKNRMPSPPKIPAVPLMHVKKNIEKSPIKEELTLKSILKPIMPKSKAQPKTTKANPNVNVRDEMLKELRSKVPLVPAHGDEQPGDTIKISPSEIASKPMPVEIERSPERPQPRKKVDRVVEQEPTALPELSLPSRMAEKALEPPPKPKAAKTPAAPVSPPEEQTPPGETSVRKSSLKAEKLIESGDIAMERKDLKEASRLYSSAICTAPDKSPHLAAALAQRALISYYAESWTSCLRDIDRALAILGVDNHGHVPQWVEIQKEVKTKSEILIRNTVKYPDQQIYEFLHPRIPWMTSCAKIVFDTKKGRKMVAAKRIPKGAVVIREYAYAWSIEDRYNLFLCQFCCQPLPMDWLPCTECSREDVRFCSITCLKHGWDEFHQFECAPEDHQDIHPMFQDNPAPDRMSRRVLVHLHPTDVLRWASQLDTINYKFGSGPRDNFGDNLRSLVALRAYEDDESWDWGDEPLPKVLAKQYPNDIRSEKYQKAAIDMLKELRLRMISNASSMQIATSADMYHMIEPKGSALYPVAALINHSCLPNLRRHFNGNTIEVRSTMDIQEGEEMCVSYGVLFGRMPRRDRKEMLEGLYGFDCDCMACTDPDFLTMEGNMFAQPGQKNYSQSINKMKERLNDAEKQMHSNRPRGVKICEEVLDMARAYFGPDNYILFDFLIPIIEMYSAAGELDRLHPATVELCRMLVIYYGTQIGRDWYQWHMRSLDVAFYDKCVKQLAKNSDLAVHLYGCT